MDIYVLMKDFCRQVLQHLSTLNKMIVMIISFVSFCACEDYRICTAPNNAHIEYFPNKLSLTGLNSDDVQTYQPQFELWSDGASKNRYFFIPQGTQIDTSDMDNWNFPVGTKFWKDFSFDGKKVETRILEKLGPEVDGWAGISYLWDDDQSDAIKVEYGGVNVNGTSHNVPAASECFGCHGGRVSPILGFSVIQLSYDNPNGLDLSNLIDANLITSLPSEDINVPGNESEKSALGYLHANCSHCHNNSRPNRDLERCFDPMESFSFLLTADAKTIEETNTYKTAIGEVITKGKPNQSRILDLMSQRGVGEGMPPLGTKNVDTTAISLIESWINDLK